MREIGCDEIISCVERLCIKSATVLPCDLRQLIESARETESSVPGRDALADIIDNYHIAEEQGVPICQDTGMAVVFLELGQDVHITGGSLTGAINEGVRRGYDKGLLRKSIVSDPLRRTNTGDNTPAVIHIDIVEGEKLHITLAPKGFGSENMSAAKLLTPAEGRKGVEDFIVSVVDSAGARPCPPIIVGVGLGGTIEKAAILAKKALARPVGKSNPDPYYAEMESGLLERINMLGIGPQGFGGKHTALKVAIEFFPTHIAGLPCVVNIGCHATRHADETI
ncbi:MAG: fumarate hydratase [Oscillospiraceae bacterium]|nr:fumarate hydratase [Oscillospiraceae bacterium]